MTWRAWTLALALVVSGCSGAGGGSPSVAPPTSAPPALAGTPAPTNPPTPTPTPLAYLVPVTALSGPEDVELADVARVLVPEGWEADVARILPGAEVVPLPLTELLLRASEDPQGIALLPPDVVGPSVKTVAVDGQYFWDKDLHLDTYPLRIEGRPGPDGREGLWELVAAGSFIFGRGVQQRIEDVYGGDARAALVDVRAITSAGDLTIGTLEAPLSGNGNRYCQGCLVFVGDERYAAAVADAGFHVLSLAGNHSGDAGPTGVLDSMRALDAVDIRHFGAGADAAAAARPLVIQRAGVRIAFLGYGDVPPVDYGATVTRPGHNRLEHDDAGYARVREAVAAARRLADLVIVMPHWGIEYEPRPRPWIVEAARAMAEAGADVIIGDHPHWVQPIEVHRGAFVAYSVGNFVFDQMWSEETRRGTILRLSFRGPRLVAARAVPTIIEDYYRPRPLAPEEPAYRAVLDRLWRTSVTGP